MLVFDIETNGLYADVTKLFCLSVYDTDTQEMKQYDDVHAEQGVHELYDAWKRGVCLCGHNVINYDLPTLAKLFPWFEITHDMHKDVVDTLVLSRLIYSHIEDMDAGLIRKKQLPSKLYKSHSLKAWGYRLGELKGTYGEEEDAWACYSPEMLAYNKQDVVVTVKLYEKLASYDYAPKATKLEHEVAWLMSKQEKNGFPFDLEKAKELEATLRARAGVLTAKLIQIVPRVPDKIFVPKRDNKRLGYKAGVPVQKYKDFNPNSRQQIEWLLRTHYGYSPSNIDCYDVEDTDADAVDLSQCRLKIDDESMKFMKEDPQAPNEVKAVVSVLEESLMLKKRLGQLADGNNAWLSMIGKDGNIHGSVIPNGAVSGRATHSRPNVAQVPHVGSPYGKECRELFRVPDGWWQAGIDACGLELRCLAHFMYKYDGGQYAHTILNGDIHTMNQKAAGLPTRNQAKTFIYAYLYGAGDAKIGKIIGGTAGQGKQIKKKFNKAIPAIANLRQAVENALVYPIDFKSTHGKPKVTWKRHFLYGLDRRKLHVRSPHSALNLLLQSAGALICKKWIVTTEERLLARGLRHGWNGDFALMAWVHDEQQIACRTEEIAKIVCEEAQQAMRDTQEYFKFHVQLDTEGIIGHNWFDCH